MATISKEQLNVILKNAPAGTNKVKLVEDLIIKDGNTIEGLDSNIIKQNATKTAVQAEPVKQESAFDRIKNDITQRGENVNKMISGEGEFADKSALERGVGATAETFGAISSTVYNVLPEGTRNALDQLAGGIGKGFKLLTDKIAETPLFKDIGDLEAQGFLNKDNAPELAKTESGLNIAKGFGDIANQILAADQAVKLGNKTVNVAKKIPDAVAPVVDTIKSNVSTIADKTVNALDSIKTNITKYPKKLVDKITSGKINQQTQTMLKEAPVEKFDRYVQAGLDAVNDPRILTPLEKAGETVKRVLGNIKEDLGNIGKQKSASLESVGKTKIPNIATDQLKKIEPYLQKNLTNAERGIINEYISELKKLGKNPTAASVDAMVDKLQATLFEKSTGTAIPTTPRIKSVINSSIGEINSNLKAVVDEALGGNTYSTLNSSYSTKIKMFNKLNKALGAEGTKGGSLLKRFFSPQDSGVKTLFKEIKDAYGVDLAQDATIAKFVMETLGDTRASSFLSLPPTSVQGIIGKGLEVIEKKLTSPEKVFKKARSITNK